MKRLETNEPKKMEYFNNYKKSLKSITSNLDGTPKQAISDLLEYSHDSLYLIESLNDWEVEYLLQLYGVCYYHENTVEEFAEFFKCSVEEINTYSQYLLHKLYPDKINYPKNIDLSLLEMFFKSCSKIAKFKYK